MIKEDQVWGVYKYSSETEDWNQSHADTMITLASFETPGTKLS